MVQPPSIIGNHLIMKRSTQSVRRVDADRKALRRRVKQFYLRFNEEDWGGCFALIDPQLAKHGKVELATYAVQMQAFKRVYGRVEPWLTRVSLHLDVSVNQRDKRPFAYVYLVWQDES